MNVGINIGIPAPPKIVLAAPGPLWLFRTHPSLTSPAWSSNIFAYGGRYYTMHDGSWFHAKSHNGPWVFIATERVPKPVVADARDLLQDSSGPRQEDGTSGPQFGGFRGLVPSGAGEEGALLTPAASDRWLAI